MAAHNLAYVRQSLGAGEEIIFVGEFHWIYTLKAILCIFWGFVGAAFIVAASVYFEGNYGKGFASRDWLGMVRELNPAIRLGSFMVFILGLVSFARKMVVRSATEIVITSTRLIFKRGLVARFVGEMNIDRIESVNVLQSFWGRLLGYGRILVHGMGVGEILLPPLRDPLGFRRAIDRARNS